jgi:hypothetical protein
MSRYLTLLDPAAEHRRRLMADAEQHRLATTASRRRRQLRSRRTWRGYRPCTTPAGGAA